MDTRQQLSRLARSTESWLLVGTLLVSLLLLASVGCGSQTTPPTAASSKEITTSSGVTMVLVPGGTMRMGSDTGAADESPKHEVTVSSFAMDKYEVTQDLLARLELPDPSHFKGERRPVEQVRWSDAALLCNERSIAEGLEPCYDEATFACNFEASGYRLPTEAEWEYAARAGDDSDASTTLSPQELKTMACYAGSSQKMTDLVGTRRPNAWGLHDMLGNIAEWCNDVYAPDYYGKSPSQDPRGPAEGPKRVLRGGSWKSSEDACRVSARAGDNPGISDACFARDSYGFRCVRRPTADKAELSPAVQEN